LRSLKTCDRNCTSIFGKDYNQHKTIFKRILHKFSHLVKIVRSGRVKVVGEIKMWGGVRGGGGGGLDN
jgi:hypothetical protein